MMTDDVVTTFQGFRSADSLAGIPLALTNSGRTLPCRIVGLRNLMADEPAAASLFGTRLLHVGFLGGTADRYTRRFSRMATRKLHVTDVFPRLARENVAIEIRRVRYEIDLDLISTGDHEIGHALG
jgi:hypothetical protein